MRRPFAAVVASACLMAACSGSAGPTSTAAPATTTTSTSTTSTTTTTTTTLPPPTGPVEAVTVGIGDDYFPTLGNTGYDVDHYFLDLTFAPDTSTLTAAVTIEATATEDLPTFNLDFIGFEILDLLVDGRPADHARTTDDLTVRPAAPVSGGEAFTVEVVYTGTPEPIPDAALPFGVGWNESPSGQHYVVAEPNGARTWFPANDHPLDKATFTFHVTVPDPLLAAANGNLVEQITDLGSSTWVWDMPYPMAPYLATVVIGPYELVEDPVSTEAAGIPVRNVLPADLVATPPVDLDRTGEMIAHFSELFGPYPFDVYGIAVVDDLPAALENQTLSVFGRGLLFDLVYVHELAHQWFGDHVSPASWRDIWLNEGFASYAEWLWMEREQGVAFVSVAITDERNRFVEFKKVADLPPPGSPPPDDLFSPSVYRIGAMALHALRLQVGDDAFFTTLRTYVERHGGGSASTADFVAIAEEVAGTDLDEWVDSWLYGDTIPEFPT